MAKAHDRYVELVFVATNTGSTVAVSAMNYYRTPSETVYPIKFVQDASQVTGTKLALGELLPPPTHFLLTFTTAG